MALLYKNLSKDVNYEHDIDAYEPSKATKGTLLNNNLAIERDSLKRVNSNRVRPKSLSSSVQQRHGRTS